MKIRSVDRRITKNKRLIIGLSIIVIFALFIVSLSLYFNLQRGMGNGMAPLKFEDMSPEEVRQKFSEEQSARPIFVMQYIIPFSAFLGLLVGIIVYYIMSERITQKDISLEKNTKIILDFLDENERTVINNLLDNNGSVRQYELSYLPGLTKVKTHRILERLEKKGVIKKERLGKVNRIVLNKELHDVLTTS